MPGQIQSERAELGSRDLQAVGRGEFRLDIGLGSGRQLVHANPVSTAVFVPAGGETNPIRMTISSKFRKPHEYAFVLVSIFPTVMTDSRILGVLDFGAQLLETLDPVTNAGRSNHRVRTAVKNMH